MTVHGGGRPFIQEDLNAAYLSDESDFYGDDAVKESYECRANEFSPDEWWRHKVPFLMEIADKNVNAAMQQQTTPLYNYYQGDPYSWQLEESVDEFLTRLPPATTPSSEQRSWIRISNPYRKVTKLTKQANGGQNLPLEGPPDEDSDWAKFSDQGQRLLEELLVVKNEIEKERAGQAKSAISSAVTMEKNRVVQEILDTADKLHCTSGKWMIFSPPEEVNTVWSAVARATVNNDLGVAAKVAPDDGNTRKPRLVCIYTKDFTDMEDVSRVLLQLKSLGLVQPSGKSIYYKCDAYTYLGLNSTNQYSIRASLYDSRDFLKPKAQQPKGVQARKLDFVYTEKKDDGNWRSMDLE